MELYAFLIALVLVVTKMVLEFIEMKDRKNGLEVSGKDYTIRGVLKLMRKERKEKKRRKNSGIMETPFDEKGE